VDLSPKTEYALLALMELAKRFKDGEPLQTRQIAEQQQIPDRYLEQLMGILRQQGLVTSQRGAKGGYLLSREPWQISLLDVILAMEGKANPSNGHNRSIESLVLNEIWQKAKQEAYQIFQDCTLQDLCDQRDAQAQSSITYYI
jgi:Rrf2 family transcriptional regulator, cysteine metabolism repressor